MVSPTELARMRAVSGSVIDDRPLVAFLYVLMRDYITPGAVEEIMSGNNLDVYNVRDISFTNGWVARNAQDVADRLLGTDCAESQAVPGD